MSRTRALVALLLLATPVVTAQPPPKSGTGATCRLEHLAWLSGHWRREKGQRVSEELWMPPAGGLMLGVHRDLQPNGTAFFEYLRIEERKGRLVYVASPRGQGTTEFTLVECGPRSVVFENPTHDFPRRIRYWSDGDILWARIEGVRGDQPASAEWSWLPVRQ
ncbi:MAG: DUF6265 family protein [Acidobacteriota bacterium]